MQREDGAFSDPRYSLGCVEARSWCAEERAGHLVICAIAWAGPAGHGLQHFHLQSGLDSSRKLDTIIAAAPVTSPVCYTCRLCLLHQSARLADSVYFTSLPDLQTLSTSPVCQTCRLCLLHHSARLADSVYFTSLPDLQTLSTSPVCQTCRLSTSPVCQTCRLCLLHQSARLADSVYFTSLPDLQTVYFTSLLDLQTVFQTAGGVQGNVSHSHPCLGAQLSSPHMHLCWDGHLCSTWELWFSVNRPSVF